MRGCTWRRRLTLIPGNGVGRVLAASCAEARAALPFLSSSVRAFQVGARSSRIRCPTLLEGFRKPCLYINEGKVRFVHFGLIQLVHHQTVNDSISRSLRITPADGLACRALAQPKPALAVVAWVTRHAKAGVVGRMHGAAHRAAKPLAELARVTKVPRPIRGMPDADLDRPLQHIGLLRHFQFSLSLW